MFLFSQQKKAIRPLPAQSQIPNPEYEKVLMDYKGTINLLLSITELKPKLAKFVF